MTVAGLPLHPLVVHLAVILAPLAALGLIVTGWNARWRQRYGFALALIALVAGGAAFLAAQSGESLQEGLKQAARASGTDLDLRDHPGDGQLAEILAMVLAVAAVVSWALEHWRDQFSTPSWTPRATYALVTVIAVASLVTMVSAGHSGASLVWKDLGTFAGQR